MVLKMLLVFIMLVQIPGKVRIMGKSKIICHIMHHFAKPAPVNALLAFFGIIVNKSFHLTLDSSKVPKYSCFFVRKDGLISGRMLPRQNAFLWDCRLLVAGICLPDIWLPVYGIFYATASSSFLFLSIVTDKKQ